MRSDKGHDDFPESVFFKLLKGRNGNIYNGKMNYSVGHSCSVSHFKGILLYCGLKENAFWVHGNFLLQCPEWLLGKNGLLPLSQSGV